MGSITFTNIRSESDGSYGRKDAHGAFGSSYNNTGNIATTGETVTALSIGLSQIIGVEMPSEDAGYSFQVLGLEDGPAASCRIKVFQGASGTTGNTTATGTVAAPALTMNSYTPAGTNGTSAVTGTGTYTDAATSGALNVGTPVFSGTGQSSAGQVITTTDNQTMTLNQCAGMWFVSATHGPYLIASNTAVSGAQAVLTIYGAAPTTDAGTYKIVRNIAVGSVTALSATAAAQTFTGTPAVLTGTNSAPAFTGVAHNHSIGAAAGGEVPNGTNLSVSLAKVQFTIFGK